MLASDHLNKPIGKAFTIYMKCFINYKPNPIVAMNKAIASSYAISKENALKELQQIKGLENHHLYYTPWRNLF
jgi:predicted RNA polymerase sigma factor